MYEIQVYGQSYQAVDTKKAPVRQGLLNNAWNIVPTYMWYWSV